MRDHSISEKIEICWGKRRIVAELRRTDRRVLRIDVGPTGEVAILAPVGEEIDEIRSRAHRKSAWIFAQIDTIAQRPKLTPTRRFISGETHLLLGRQYRLAIEQSNDPHVRIEGGRMVISARSTDDQPHCRRLLHAYYALRAREVFRQRLEIVAEPFIRKGLKRPPMIIRRMSKRWGSFTPGGRVVLNVDLVRASFRLIDYVICHELAHAFYPDHGEEWSKLLRTVMPDWEERKGELEAKLR
ncbi:M48 family metallopeptidase [Phyllobacterium zundukense]|uniref:M48 family metallopeptidase n=1 Tax=Phyllobacterium zundukense TaxID=1867719 RepID=A0ACD4CV56_9HYPH|nr:SprT family zinc-dependent metalloprotease [Phyllobacterium zundukense]UXN57461.1 M48 family metallopeptidase [Phyllobacterium zundukense]